MRKKKVLSEVLIILIMIYLVIPFAVTLIYSLSTEWTGILPSGFTLKNYVHIFSDRKFIESIGRTVIICAVSVLITIIMLLLVMFVVVMNAPWLGKCVQFICMIPYALQGVILSISVISLYAATETFLSNRMLMLFGTYSVLVLPFIYQGIRSNINAVNGRKLIHAAEILGCSEIKAYVSVVIPNIMPGIIVSALLAESVVFGDFVLANNIAGTNYQNVQVYLYANLFKSSGVSAAIVVVIFAVVFIITGAVLKLKNLNRKRYGTKI